MLVTILIIAIIIVLVLMWQAGMFSTTDSAGVASSTPPSNDVQAPGQTRQPTETDDSTATPVQADKLAAPGLEPIVKRPTGKDQESIRALAQNLIAAHPLDMSSCRTEVDAGKALDCAAALQSKVLAAVFEDYAAKRAAGDLTANARGGEVLKQVIAELSTQLKPFEDAAK